MGMSNPSYGDIDVTEYKNTSQTGKVDKKLTGVSSVSEKKSQDTQQEEQKKEKIKEQQDVSSATQQETKVYKEELSAEQKLLSYKSTIFDKIFTDKLKPEEVQIFIKHTLTYIKKTPFTGDLYKKLTGNIPEKKDSEIVAQLAQVLSSLGFYTGKNGEQLDIKDPKSFLFAVKAFQGFVLLTSPAQKIDQLSEPDGVVGPKTLTSLIEWKQKIQKQPDIVSTILRKNKKAEEKKEQISPEISITPEQKNENPELNNTGNWEPKELYDGKKREYITTVNIESLLKRLKENKQLPSDYKGIIAPFLISGFSKESDFTIFSSLTSYKPEFNDIASSTPLKNGNVLRNNNPQKQYEVLSSAEKGAYTILETFFLELIEKKIVNSDTRSILKNDYSAFIEGRYSEIKDRTNFFRYLELSSLQVLLTPSTDNVYGTADPEEKAALINIYKELKIFPTMTTLFTPKEEDLNQALAM